MTFLRRYGYSEVGYTFFISALVVLWSIPLQFFFIQCDFRFDDFANRQGIGVFHLLNGLFAAGTVMISYGAVLGKVTPLQLLVMAIIEPVFYWFNIFIIYYKLNTHDIGGGYAIHVFGCYYGLAVTFFLTEPATHNNPDNTNCYNSDLFSLAGTLFLWLLWPSFNAVTATPGIAMLRAVVNTLLSLCGAVVMTFGVSRLVSKGKFNPVFVENATLAGGVVMGAAADLNINPAVAIGMGGIAGTVSTLGYKWLTPFLNNKLNIQDICGINNLHGMPGIIGCILSIFATLQLARGDSSQFPHGMGQAGIQAAALGITIGLAVLGGFVTGLIVWFLKWVGNLFPEEFFNDRTYWDIPSDYEKVVREEEEEELKDMKEAVSSGQKHTLSRGKTQILSRNHPKPVLKREVQNGSNGIKSSDKEGTDTGTENEDTDETEELGQADQ